jgi:hypothetical protein
VSLSSIDLPLAPVLVLVELVGESPPSHKVLVSHGSGGQAFFFREMGVLY